MYKYLERLYNGIIKENPTFVLMLGMCPTLAVTSSAINGLGMGLSTTVVLVCSNLLISLFRKVIPNGVRMPAFIVIVASLVTVVQFLMAAYLPSLSASLGVYIPLIVVNCIILGRAESYASKNGPAESVFDGFGMGVGFTIGLTLIGLIREFLGAGSAFGWSVFGGWFTTITLLLVVPGAFLFQGFAIGSALATSLVELLLMLSGHPPRFDYSFISKLFEPITIFILAPGAFLVLAFLVAIMNIIRGKMEAKGKPLAQPSGCLAGDCSSCSMKCDKKPEVKTEEGGDK